MNSTFSRRDFLRGTAATAAAFGLPTLVPSIAYGANDKMTIGCIGVGGMGMNNTKSFLAEKDCRVVAVCDVQQDRVNKAKALVDQRYGDKGCATFGDYRQLLARQDIDAVMIAVQDHWHSLIATAAADAGKDMYCEKPTGVCVHDGQAMRAALRKNKRVFQSGMWQRSSGNFRQGCELALNGYLGKLKEIQVSVPAGKSFQPRYKGPYDPQPAPAGFNWAIWQGPAPDKPFNPGRVAWPDWYLINDYCEGWTTNWGVHHLDIAHWGCPELGREPFEIECSGTYYTNKGFADNIESWKAVFTYRKGLRLVFTDTTSLPAGTKFIGEKGWVHVSRGNRITAEPASLLTIRPKQGDTRLLPSGLKMDDVITLKTRAGDRIAYRSLWHAKGFLDAMGSRKEPIAGIDATHVASTLGMVAGIAARMGTTLKWDWKTERFVNSDKANRLLVRPMHNGWKLES